MARLFVARTVDGETAAAIPTTPTPTVPTLAALLLSSTAYMSGTAASGTITGATAGSTIVLANGPSGFSINSAARTWAYNGSGGAASGSLTLTETLSGATGSPKASAIAYTVAAAALTAPVIVWTSGTSTRDPIFTFTGIELNDVVKLQFSTSNTFSPLFGEDTNTVDAVEASDGLLTFPAIPTLDFATTYYARAYTTRGGVTSAASATVSKTMDAAPVFVALSPTNKTANTTLTNDNHTAEATGSEARVLTVAGPTTGKYWVAIKSDVIVNEIRVGFMTPAGYQGTIGTGYPFFTNGTYMHDGTTGGFGGPTFGTVSAGVMFFVDTDANKIWPRDENGYTHGDPGAGGAGIAVTDVGAFHVVLMMVAAGDKATINVGYTTPPYPIATGFPALKDR